MRSYPSPSMLPASTKKIVINVNIIVYIGNVNHTMQELELEQLVDHWTIDHGFKTLKDNDNSIPLNDDRQPYYLMASNGELYWFLFEI